MGYLIIGILIGVSLIIYVAYKKYKDNRCPQCHVKLIDDNEGEEALGGGYFADKHRVYCPKCNQTIRTYHDNMWLYGN